MVLRVFLVRSPAHGVTALAARCENVANAICDVSLRLLRGRSQHVNELVPLTPLHLPASRWQIWRVHLQLLVGDYQPDKFYCRSHAFNQSSKNKVSSYFFLSWLSFHKLISLLSPSSFTTHSPVLSPITSLANLAGARRASDALFI